MELRFDQLKDRVPQICDQENYRNYGVVMPLIEKNGQFHLVFEIRSPKLSTQPGEICFPGGGIEKGESPKQAALRETCEELCIFPKQVHIQFPLDTIVSASSGIIHPFLAVFESYENTFHKDEVASIFTIPLTFFLSTPPIVEMVKTKVIMPASFPFKLIPKGKEYDWGEGKYFIQFYEYGNKIIWGITARIIHNFVRIIQQ